jgi:hypothetical protein
VDGNQTNLISKHVVPDSTATKNAYISGSNGYHFDIAVNTRFSLNIIARAVASPLSRRRRHCCFMLHAPVMCGPVWQMLEVPVDIFKENRNFVSSDG